MPICTAAECLDSASRGPRDAERAHWFRAALGSAVLLGTLGGATLSGCETASEAPARAQPSAGTATTPAPATAATTEPAPVLEPYTQRIDGTDLTMDFRPVPATAVSVGGHLVDVPAFYAATTETTWDLYDLFVYGEGDVTDSDGAIVSRPSKPYVAPDLGYGHQGYAAISVAFRGAESFCAWLSARTGVTYRLPTEAEWLAMCAGGGVTDASRDAHAWHDGNADYTPHPVGTAAPDALGLFDVWGNVREWATTLDGAPIALGGSFYDYPEEVGCAARHVPDDSWQMTDPQVPKSTWWLSDAPFMGFRVIRVP